MARVRRGISWSIALILVSAANAQAPDVHDADRSPARVERQSRVRWVLPDEYRPRRQVVDGDALGYTAHGRLSRTDRSRSYEGPTMRDGYGLGYDSLAYRYGLEEALQERYYIDLERRYSRYDYPTYRPQPYGQHRARHRNRYRTDVYRYDVVERNRDQTETSRRLHLKDMNRRAERLLSSHERKLREGLALLRSGQPERAVVALSLASKLNQGDPASRIHLSQARLALGHYPEASAALRRALELQPKLIYEELNLGRYFARSGLMERYITALADTVDAEESGADLQFLLGFYAFQSGELTRAYEAFETAADMRPRDNLIRSYLAITKPATIRR